MASITGQTTTAQQYADAILLKMVPNRAKQIFFGFLQDRAMLLGLPQSVQGQQGGPPQRMQAFSGMTLQQKVDTLTSAVFASILTAAAGLSAVIQSEIRTRVTDLGGVSAIDANGEWGWLLAKNGAGALVWFPDNVSFTVPGIPFPYTFTPQGGSPTTVNVGYTADGATPPNITITYTNLDGSAYTGPAPL